MFKYVNSEFFRNLGLLTINCTILFQVRVVEVPGVSMELCGGTHVSNTAEIRGFKIISEQGIASGIRRIEAVAGEAFIEYVSARDNYMKQLCSTLKVSNSKKYILVYKQTMCLYLTAEVLGSLHNFQLIKQYHYQLVNIFWVAVLCGCVNMQCLLCLQPLLNDGDMLGSCSYLFGLFPLEFAIV